MDGNCLSWLNISSGVPQGSILGPWFFVIFISDVPEKVSPENTVALNADDCKVFRVMSWRQLMNCATLSYLPTIIALGISAILIPLREKQTEF